MVNGNKYKERRENLRKTYLEEKRAGELKYKKYVQKISEQFSYVGRSIDSMLINEEKILEKVHIYKGSEEFLKRINDYTGSPILENIAVLRHGELASDNLRYARREARKVIKAELLKMERTLQNYLANVSFPINEVYKMISNPMFKFVPDANINSLKQMLNKIREATQIKDYGKFDEFIKRLKDNLRGDFLNSTTNYMQVIESYKPQTDEKRIKEIAKLNICLLEEEARSINENKFREEKDYFNSLEGILLAYSTFKLEQRKVGDEDLDYAMFLSDKTEDKLALLKNKPKEDIMINLENLRKGIYITDNEYIFLKISLEKELEKKPEIILKEKKEYNVESIQRKALFIADYKIPSNDAIRIAGLVSEEDIARVPRELNGSLESDLVELLIKANPELFLMDKEQIQKYISKFKEVKESVKGFSMINDFDPYTSPQNFSSFDALQETKKRLYSMVRRTGAAETNGETRQQISEFERIKIDLAREGYEPDMTMAIIGRGLYFSGQYFIGTHRLPIEHLERNAKKDPNIDFDKKQCGKELRKIMNSGAILFKLGGYSLNPHTKKIKSDALRRAVNYALSHHPKEERFEAGLLSLPALKIHKEL